MRLLAALIAAAIAGGGLAACGTGTDSPARVPSEGASSSTGSIHRNDRDNDSDHNDDDEGTLGYGHLAGAADRQAIDALVRRYFTDAAAESGARACALLTPFVAERVVEVNGHTATLRGKTCAIVMTKLFRQHHRDLVGKSANLQVMRIGVQSDKSLVALDFPEIPEVRQIAMRRYNGRWTVLQLLDGIIE
jgi:hypothetical protein